MAFKRFALPSGLTLLVEHNPTLLTSTVAFFTLAGSVYDGKDKQGIAHLVEHMLVNGSVYREAEEVLGVFDRLGGHLQAYTAKEYTCLFTRVLADCTSDALELLAELLLMPALAGDRLEREKQVVAEEARLYTDTPQRHVSDLALAALWPQHPFGWPTLGLPTTVERLTTDDLSLFHQTYYRPSSMVCVVASPHPAGRVLEWLEGLTGIVDRGPPRSAELSSAQRLPVARPRWVVHQMPTQQVHICLGFPAPGLADPGYYATDLLSALLGGTASGRLYKTLRRDDGLIYLVNTAYTAFSTAGALSIYAGTSPERSAQLWEKLLLVLDEASSVREEELQRVRQRVKGAVASMQEQPGDRVTVAGRDQLLTGRVREPHERLRALDDVTPDRVAEMSASILRPDNMAVAVVGPISSKEVERWREYVQGAPPVHCGGECSA